MSVIKTMKEIKTDDNYTGNGSAQSEDETVVRDVADTTFRKENISSAVDFNSQIEQVVDIVDSPWVLQTCDTPEEVEIEEATEQAEPYVVDFTQQFHRIFVRTVFNSFEG